MDNNLIELVLEIDEHIEDFDFIQSNELVSCIRVETLMKVLSNYNVRKKDNGRIFQ